MKANELMIGDWVWYNNQPHQIRQLGIFGENRDGDDYPAVCVGKPNGVGLILERNEIEPIPLTPEILEKNGFRIIFEGELHTTYFQDIEGFHVEIKIDKIGYIKLSMINGLGYSIVTECKFVHQLQHALRLCEIEKEIIL